MDTSIAPDSARVSVVLQNEQVFTKHVEHAVGSRSNPLSDVKLKEKFNNGCKSVGMHDAEVVSYECWGLETVDDIWQLTKYL
ncbi:unnamed protein product [Fusarium venenatum]|uniref:Uncharacterized protein n=1 Tax=Fusarium venenatum TaxID=56646 RepID=A0A2L2TPF5_9HYPO|nr:uncharacterized protein FVRRES_10470 [Fusarium venenatum]CEI70393.1 unnamed protein product [Fusarium venenatum]